MIIGSKLIFFKNLSSTNLHASHLLKGGNIGEGTIIYTNFQLSGRGQMGNSWESEDGKNLLFSVVLNPSNIKPEEQFIISKTICLGICDFIKRYISEVRIKWPNDIYIKDDKIAGVLIENSITGNEIENVIAGIGLNINQERFTRGATNPVSLKMITGYTYNLDKCLSDLASDLDVRYKMLLNEKIPEIDNDYIALLYRFNAWHHFKDARGQFEGRITSVSNNGKLQIEDRTGETYKFDFKEVDFVRS